MKIETSRKRNQTKLPEVFACRVIAALVISFMASAFAVDGACDANATSQVSQSHEQTPLETSANDCFDAIRVGTYNILNSGYNKVPYRWSDRKEDLINLIIELKLDVFGLQEACPDQVAYILERMDGYDVVGDYRNADRKTGEASPVCYSKRRFDALDNGTFWLSETPDVPGSKSWGSRYSRVCTYLILKDKKSGKKFCFTNAHPDHASSRAREKGMLLITERMRQFGADMPIVFTGDHNCNENEKPALIVSKVLRNSLYETKTPPKGPWRSYNGKVWKDHELSAVEALACPISERNTHINKPGWAKFGAHCDYIYVSSCVGVLEYRTVNVSRPGRQLYPSDHFPVVATIKLP